MEMGRQPKPRRPKKPAVSPEEQAMFMDAIEGTVPMTGRDRVAARPEPIAPPRPVVREVVPTPQALALDAGGEQLAARAPGVNRAQVAELRRGRVRPEATLDLHGFTVDEGDVALRRFLADAQRLRRRCVLVVHGRGLHAGGVSVLRDSVVGALTGSLSGYVHCLSTAAPADGGAGATYVMVKS
jgi:DNA-nicking Smr family endonuclease